MPEILIHDVPLGLKDAEMHLITVALGISSTRYEAADKLGITRHTLLRRVRQFKWSDEKVDGMLSTYTALVERPKSSAEPSSFEWIPIGSIPYQGEAANDV